MTAMAVDSAHAHPGAPSRSAQPSSPERNGALPSAIRAATATPVRAVPMKKKAW